MYEEGADLGEEDGVKRKEVKRGRDRPKKMERKVVGVPDLDVHELSDSSDSESFNATTPTETRARVLEYLENIEEIRKKSKNIKGDLSGIIKKRLKDSKVIVRALMRKADKKKEKEKETDKDRDWEVKILKMTNKELEMRLKEKEKKEKQEKKKSSSYTR